MTTDKNQLELLNAKLREEKLSMLGQIGIFIFTRVLEILYIVVDQGMSARISHEYLAAISFMAYVPLLFQIVGSSIGQSMLVLLSRATTPLLQSKLFSGALICGILAAITMTPILFFTKNLFLGGTGTSQLAGVTIAYYLMIATSFFMLFKTIGSYSLSALKKRKASIVWDIVGNILNFVGDMIALKLFAKPEDQFIGIVVTTFIVHVVYFGFAAHFFKNLIELNMENLKNYLGRAKNILPSEIVQSASLLMTPFFISIIFNSGHFEDGVVAYNVGYRMLTLLALPAFAISVSGTVWLSSVWEDKHKKEWEGRLKILFMMAVILGVLPTLIAIAFLPVILTDFFKMESMTSLIVAGIVLSSTFPGLSTAHLICQFRVFERQRTVAVNLLITNYAIGIPMAYFFAKRGSIVGVAISSSLLPALLRMAWYHLKLDSLSAERRYHKRQDVPRSMEAVVHVEYINGNLVSCKLDLENLSQGGCQLRAFDVSSFKIFCHGDMIEGHLEVQGKNSLYIRGMVRNTKKQSDYLWKRKRGGTIGIEFMTLSQHDIRHIRTLIWTVNPETLDSAA